MKKYLSHILVSTFLLTILVGVGGSVFPQGVYAQEAPDCSSSNPLAYLNPLCGPLTSTGRSQATAAAAGEAAVWVISTVVVPISLLILRITSLLTILSGGILNFVVNHTIVEMAQNYKQIGAISGAWGTVRDVANMGFIFILLYASIQMILGIGKDTRKLIVNIIIAALLINFSMFFTQIIIDASNIIALTFYHAIAPAAEPGKLLQAGLSNSLMAPLHFETIWNMKSTLTNGNIAVIGIMGSVVTLIAAFIFFAVALMLVIRYVVLILVLILSPIAFIGDVIPGASDYAKQWRNALFGQAFFAPVYMFLTWITIKMFNDPKMFPTSAGKSWAEAFGGEATTNTANVAFSDGSVGLVFNFVVIIVFLIATLILSKKVSDSAGQGINKLTSKALGYAGGATIGMAGYAGRRTIGAAGTAVANSEWLKNKEKQSGASGMMARLSLKSGQKLAKQSFDVRGTALGDALDAGKVGGKGGYEQMVKDQAKAKEEFAKSLAPSDIVVDRAKQNLEKAKRTGVGIAAAQAEVYRLEGNKKAVEDDVKSEEEKKKNAVSKAKENTALKDALENEKALRDIVAKLQIDLKSAGVTEKDAAETRLRIAREEFEAAKARTAGARKTVDENVSKIEEESKKKIADIKAGEIKGLGELRKQASAIRISNPAPISPDRVMFIGKVKQSSLQAAANLRKDKKDAKKLIEEALKATGEIKEGGKKEGGDEPKPESSEPKTT